MLFNTSQSSNVKEEIEASVVLNDIVNGSANYTDILIKGDLNLSQAYEKMSAKSLEDSAIIITDSVVEGTLDFRNAHFQQPLILDRLEVKGDALFNDSIFDKFASFNGLILNRKAYFVSDSFNEGTDFQNLHAFEEADFSYSEFRGRQNTFVSSIFENRSNFQGSKFNGVTDFTNSTFIKDVKFSKSDFDITAFMDCDFNGDALFIFSNFHNGTNFYNSDFCGNLIFSGTTFNEIIKFEMCRFLNLSAFGRCSFMDDVIFDQSIFGKITYFNDSKFNSTAYFRGVQFNNDTSFNNVKFYGDVRFEGAQFNGNLVLDGANYDRLFIRVNTIKHINFNETAYQYLINNLKQIGFIDDANECYVRFMADYTMQPFYAFLATKFADFNRKGNAPANPSAQSNKGTNGKSSIIEESIKVLYFIFYFFAWIFYGFGRKPEYTIFWSILFIAIFDVFWSYKNLQKEKYLRRTRVGAQDGWHRLLRKRSLKSIFSILAISTKFSFTIFLAGTRLFIETPQLPKAISSTWAKRLFWAERVIGAIFSLLFFLAISNTVLSSGR